MNWGAMIVAERRQCDGKPMTSGGMVYKERSNSLIRDSAMQSELRDEQGAEKTICAGKLTIESAMANCSSNLDR